MPKTLTVDDSGLPLIEPGVYKATFSRFEDMKNLPYGAAIKLYFQILEGEHEGVELNMLAREKLSAQSKLGQAIMAMTGKSLRVKDNVTLDELIGSVVKILVETVQGKNGYADFSSIEKVAAETDDIPF